jgi:hypothetical protein
MTYNAGLVSPTNTLYLGFGSDQYGITLGSTARASQFATCNYASDWEYPTGSFERYVMVRSEVILGYERTIQELRRELFHYKLLHAQAQTPTVAARDELRFEPSESTPMNADSVRILNSIIAATPHGSAYEDTGQGDL